jgi:hypothetical protein
MRLPDIMVDKVWTMKKNNNAMMECTNATNASSPKKNFMTYNYGLTAYAEHMMRDFDMISVNDRFRKSIVNIALYF